MKRMTSHRVRRRLASCCSKRFVGSVMGDRDAGLGTDCLGLGTGDWGLGGNDGTPGTSIAASRGFSALNPSPQSPVPVVSAYLPMERSTFGTARSASFVISHSSAGDAPAIPATRFV